MLSKELVFIYEVCLITSRRIYTFAWVETLNYTKYLGWTGVLKFFFFDVYLFLRAGKNESASGGGTEREGDTASEAGSRL